MEFEITATSHKHGCLFEDYIIFDSFLNKICKDKFSCFTFDISKRKRRGDTNPCSVVKLADTPSYLGGEDSGIKQLLFGAAA
jgi:hypothetical protein